MTAHTARKVPQLRPGARIALVAPGGPVTGERIDAAASECREFGFEPVLGLNAGARLGYLAGDDAGRAADLDAAFRDPRVDGIWALRGGYGAMRILETLDFEPMRRRPRPFIGFSDNTAIHLVLRRLGVVSFHGPHPGALATAFSRECLARVLGSPEPGGVLPPDPSAEPVATLAPGTAEGVLAGGNLSLLAGSCGTPWALDAAGCILVIEDVGEPIYRIDRALVQLAAAGALEDVAAFAFGRFTERPANENDRPLEDVLVELAVRYGVPAVLGLPVGHIDAQWTVPFGVRARLDAEHGRLELLEPAVVGGDA
ncbi:MAG: LD-carboxypeptidase [Gemmatimonadota bacterium]|jgi:muramoyltetrapeptide carboxypeptidase